MFARLLRQPCPACAAALFSLCSRRAQLVQQPCPASAAAVFSLCNSAAQFQQQHSLAAAAAPAQLLQGHYSTCILYSSPSQLLQWPCPASVAALRSFWSSPAQLVQQLFSASAAVLLSFNYTHSDYYSCICYRNASDTHSCICHQRQHRRHSPITLHTKPTYEANPRIRLKRGRGVLQTSVTHHSSWKHLPPPP